jgi:hypothetical protein
MLLNILACCIRPAQFGGDVMIRKLFRLAMAGLIGCALIAPLGGCDSASQSQPTIDTTTPLKAPSVQKVDVKPGVTGAKK